MVSYSEQAEREVAAAHGRSKTTQLRISGVPNSYFGPILGEPATQSFVDDQSRLFGQGAGLRVKEYGVWR
jgi:hypothetical protein